MRIPPALIESIGFIARADQPDLFLGTAFMVGVKSGPKWQKLVYHVVTAKHTIIGLKGDDGVFVFRGADGKKAYCPLKAVTWVFHPREPDCVDVAASIMLGPQTPAARPPQCLDIIMLAVGERVKRYPVGLGDEVITLGLFSAYSGSEYLEPITRTGNIAMMPKERVPHRDWGSVYAHLVESRSTGGLSGSPVFARNSVIIQTSPGSPPDTLQELGHLHLFGLVMGHYELKRQVEEGKMEPINMGVVMVTPAIKIWETLQHPQLLELRSFIDDNLERVP